MVQQGRTEKLGPIWSKTKTINKLCIWTRKLRSFHIRSLGKMRTDTILIAIFVLYAMKTSGQQTKRFLDCEKSHCVLTKSKMPIFESRNQTIPIQGIQCKIQTNQTGSKCVVDMNAVLTAVQTSQDVMLYFLAMCLTPVQITFHNSQNATKKNLISTLYLRGHCSISTSDLSNWGSATDFRVFVLMENAVHVNDNSVKMSNRSILGLENIRSLMFYKAKPKKIPEIFKKYSWPRMVEIFFTNLQLTSIPKELKTTMPLLQSLELSNNNLTKPPDFPWCSNTLNLPRGLSKKPTFNDHYEVGTIVSPKFYRRFFDLSFNMIQDLSAHEFRGLLNILNLKGNTLKSIGRNCFRRLKGVQIIDLSYNNLQDLPSQLFRHLNDLLELRLDFNQISRIPKEFFKSQRKIKRIHLDHNKVTSIPKGLFSELNKLEVLHLENNHITAIDEEAFAIDSSSLREIHLQNNKITRVPNSLLLLRQARHIDLSFNRLTFQDLDKTIAELDIGKFIYQHHEIPSSPQLRLRESVNRMSFAYNHFTTIDIAGMNQSRRKRFKLFLRVYEIDMTGNPLLCDDKILGFVRWLRHWIQNNTGLRVFGPQQFSTWKCAAPMGIKDKPILSVREDQFISKRNLSNCPKECSCYVRSVRGTVIVDCKEKDLVTMPRSVPDGQIELFLQNNNIREIPSYRYLENVTALYLSHNNIERLDKKTIDRLKRIEILFIDSNKLTFLPRNIENISFTRIALQHNFFRCDCKTKWMKHWLLRQEAHVNNIENILCHSNHVQGKAISRLRDEEFVCLEGKNEKSQSLAEPQAFKITAYTLGCLFPVFLVAFAVGYKFRGEAKVFMYTHFNWHPFDRINDSDPNKTYDAFISFSGNDYEWISNTLCVRLENHDPPYKLCLHHRDFLVGAPIQQNIFNGIEKSKRMIMILSKNFVKSEWCLLEFRAAHQKVLEDRMNYLIIILFDDVDMAEVNDEIKLYMRTNTYLSVKNKWFWEKLFYALPHNSNRETEVNDCHRSAQVNSAADENNDLSSEEKKIRTILRVNPVNPANAFHKK